MFGKKKKKLSGASVGGLVFVPKGKRLVVEEDRFRSGYECSRCLGDEMVSCDTCGGAGKAAEKRRVKNFETGLFEEQLTGSTFDCDQCAGAGKIVCPSCKGKGATVIIPDTAKRRPTTGVVRAVGPDVKDQSYLGERVIYSMFSGYAIAMGSELQQNRVVVRFLNEVEILGVLRGNMTLKDILTTDFTALGDNS